MVMSPYRSSGLRNHPMPTITRPDFCFQTVMPLIWSEQLKRPVFYLTGDIAKRLQLSAVPSIVVQKEHQMLVQEIVVPQDKQEALDDKE